MDVLIHHCIHEISFDGDLGEDFFNLLPFERVRDALQYELLRGSSPPCSLFFRHVIYFVCLHNSLIFRNRFQVARSLVYGTLLLTSILAQLRVKTSMRLFAHLFGLLSFSNLPSVLELCPRV